jgi:hypothetical protein
MPVSGNPVPEELIPCALPFDAKRIKRIVEKIIRCLYFKHFNRVLSPDSQVLIGTEPLTKKELQRTIIEHKGFVGEKKEELFLYWFGQPEKDGSLDWILMFNTGFKHFRATIQNVESCAEPKPRSFIRRNSGCLPYCQVLERRRSVGQRNKSTAQIIR